MSTKPGPLPEWMSSDRDEGGALLVSPPFDREAHGRRRPDRPGPGHIHTPPRRSGPGAPFDAAVHAIAGGSHLGPGAAPGDPSVIIAPPGIDDAMIIAAPRGSTTR